MIITGLLGGSFNPAHGGHRGISLAAIAALGLDDFWWLVSPGNPLKAAAGMAPFPARFASAVKAAAGTPIKVTGIERTLGTRYTIDTLRALVERFPERQFVWLMGADNLAQFDRWKEWREIAALVPIAVATRPGYEDEARAAPAWDWLRDHVLTADQAKGRTKWSLPALVLLTLPPDPTSSTAIRQADPDWHQSSDYLLSAKGLRDGVTRDPVI